MPSRTCRLLPPLWLAFVLLVVTLPAVADERPAVTALRVPNGAITIDGRVDDWQRNQVLQSRNQGVSADPSLIYFAFTERGRYAGPNDLSFTAWCATDADNLYLLADVHDQLLINDAGLDDAFAGDDFEVFIDANPADTRFANTLGENVRQLIFVPGFANPQYPHGIIWQAAKNPGVQMASRLRPWGYTIEVKIPKALFPRWHAQPEMDAIGFDIALNDADAPGVEIYHPASKQTAFLLSPAPHFLSPEKLGVLHLDNAFVQAKQETPADTPQQPGTLLDRLAAASDADADALAQQVLDAIESDNAATIAAAAVACRPTVLCKAGVLLLAKRADLPAPIAPLIAIVSPATTATYGNIADPDLRTYALLALAQRGKLPTNLFGCYSRADDSSLRLSFIWSLGANGDRQAVPELQHLLYDGNVRIRSLAAMALARLGDPAALPALTEMAASDPHHYGKAQAELAIKTINAARL